MTRETRIVIARSRDWHVSRLEFVVADISRTLIKRLIKEIITILYKSIILLKYIIEVSKSEIFAVR